MPRTPSSNDSAPAPEPSPKAPSKPALTTRPAVIPPEPGRDVEVAIATSGAGQGVVTARRAGTLRDMNLQVDPRAIGAPAALQNLAKSINVAFQTDYGENYLESVYQAAIVSDDEVRIVHKEYFGFAPTWFSQFGRLLKSMSLTLKGPDPASPEGQKRILDQGPATIRGILNLVGRKLDLVAEFEDRVPAYVAQMFDRLEASGLIVGWKREDWNIRTTRVGLDIRVWPSDRVMDELRASKGPR